LGGELLLRTCHNQKLAINDKGYHRNWGLLRTNQDNENKVSEKEKDVTEIPPATEET
jgi:hypothetical protein